MQRPAAGTARLAGALSVRGRRLFTVKGASRFLRMAYGHP